MANAFGILGDGAFADEVEEYAGLGAASFRAVSRRYLVPSRPELIDIEAGSSVSRETAVVAAVGAPGLRRSMVASWAGTSFQTVISDRAWVSGSARVGRGSVVAPMSSLSTRSSVGEHTIVNFGAQVAHDSVLGDFVTVSPGAVIGGHSRLDDGVFLGIGAVVRDRVSVASGSVIGAGAVVLHDISTPGVYVGVPARKLRDQKEWLHEF
jgi:sugar O-acyltransferase (sialic acid O-acetyltransferase NeuD family)